MDNSPLSTGILSLAALGMLAAAFYFILRPFWRALGPKRRWWQKGRPDIEDTSVDNFGMTALEVIALVSLARGFPYGGFGAAAGPMIVGFAVGLLFLPNLTRPLIAVVILMVAIGEGRIPAETTGYLITTVIGYLLLKWLISIFRLK